MDDENDKKCVICGKSATRMLSSHQYPGANWFCKDHVKEWEDG